MAHQAGGEMVEGGTGRYGRWAIAAAGVLAIGWLVARADVSWPWRGGTAATTASAAAPLPPAGPRQRLRWDLAALYESLNARRRERELSWEELAGQLRCSTHQLTGIRTARYAIGMRLAMRIAQWLEQPASAFIYAADW